MKLPKIEALPSLLVTPERYAKVQPIAELAVGRTAGLATITTLYPELPEVYRLYPEQSGELGR